MKVSDVMTKEVRTCRVNDTLNDAAREMWDGDCGSLPVVDDQQHVVGMITDRDVSMAAYLQGRPLREIGVASAMSRHLYVCQPKHDIGEAEAVMRDRQIRRLPVVDRDGRIAGIISLNDIAVAFDRERGKRRKAVEAEEVAETLAAICAHSNGARHPEAALAGAHA